MQVAQCRGVSRAFIITIALFWASPSLWAVAFHQNLYSEHALVNREERLTSSIRVRSEAEVVRNLSPYLQLGSELSTPSYEMNNLDNFSYFYGAPGFRVGYGAFSLYNEARFKSFYKDNRLTGQSKVDLRSLFVYGDFFSFPVTASSFLFRFAEPYSETLYTSADEHNVINASFVRLGVRGVWNPQTFTDLFVEPYITLDRVRHFYNNRADVKLSLRFIHQINPIQISFISSLLYNQYFSRGDFEKNPYSDKTTGVRFLLVVGGDL